MPSIAMALIKQEQDAIEMNEGNLVFIRRLEEGEQTGELGKFVLINENYKNMLINANSNVQLWKSPWIFPIMILLF